MVATRISSRMMTRSTICASNSIILPVRIPFFIMYRVASLQATTMRWSSLRLPEVLIAIGTDGMATVFVIASFDGSTICTSRLSVPMTSIEIGFSSVVLSRGRLAMHVAPVVCLLYVSLHFSAKSSKKFCSMDNRSIVAFESGTPWSRSFMRPCLRTCDVISSSLNWAHTLSSSSTSLMCGKSSLKYGLECLCIQTELPALTATIGTLGSFLS
mmetsp:Transcript_19671/g.35081  ORF Transcript_19671/g.35081 Transcript_19671/m.35081 type:complete len:213 (-) Transcript_19671:323-961(-)